MIRNRSGVVPYFFDYSQGKFMFVFGCDNTKFGRNSTLSMTKRLENCDITTFSGKVENSETYQTTAVRELREESLEIYNFLSVALNETFFIENNVINRGRERIYFKFMPFYHQKHFERDRILFNHRRSTSSEMIALVALDADTLKEAIRESSPTLYWRTLENFQSNKKSFFDFLQKL